MRVIIIEDMVYKVTEKHYKAIISKQKEINSNGYHPSNDVDFDDYLTSIKGAFKPVGKVEFYFRL